MRNFDAYVTNIVYGIIILLGYSFCGIIPTVLGIVTWFAAGRLLETRFEDERKAELISVAAGIAVAVISALIMKKLLAGG